MQTNQSEAQTPTTSFTGLSLSDHCPPALITPGPGIRQLGTVSMSRSLLKLFKLSNPETSYPALPISFHNKSFFLHFLPLLPHNWPWCFLCGPAGYDMACPLLLGTVSNKLSFQWQSSPNLLASPFLNHNKTFILKHSLSLIYLPFPYH